MGNKTKKTVKEFRETASKYKDAQNHALEKMAKMKFEDFKTEAVERFGELWDMTLGFGAALVEEKKRLDDCLGTIAENTQKRDKLIGDALELRDNRIEGIASVVFMLVCRAKGGGISRQERETISEIMGYKWTPKDEMAFQGCGTA